MALAWSEAAKGTTVTTELETTIRTALLESPYVGEVLEVSAGQSAAGQPLVGLRVTAANVSSVADLGPVVADFRATVRTSAGDDACVFVEIAVPGEPASALPTEAIVIRGAD